MLTWRKLRANSMKKRHLQVITIYQKETHLPTSQLALKQRLLMFLTGSTLSANKNVSGKPPDQLAPSKHINQ